MTVAKLIECLSLYPLDAIVVLNADRNELGNGLEVGRLEYAPAVHYTDGRYSFASVGVWDEADMKEFGYEEKKVVNLTAN